MEINGKKAVIVGGASGMAKASAELLRQKGADIAILDLPKSYQQAINYGLTSFAGSKNGAVARDFIKFLQSEEVKKELNLSDENARSVDNQTSKEDQEKSLRDFAAKKFNLVFGHGHEGNVGATA